MPKIIRMSTYDLPKEVLDEPVQKRFDFIFSHGFWKTRTDEETRSGKGSSAEGSALYRRSLLEFIEKNPGISFFDAPCGDLFWIRDLITDAKIDYFGGDISGEVVAYVNRVYPEVEVKPFDITLDSFPKADVWHCRHCLFHLSLADIVMALRNYAQSDISHAIITSDFVPDTVTLDIQSGLHRPLNLTNYPFYLPEPLGWLPDKESVGKDFARASGIWTRDQIATALDNMAHETEWVYAD